MTYNIWEEYMGAYVAQLIKNKTIFRCVYELGEIWSVTILAAGIYLEKNVPKEKWIAE